MSDLISREAAIDALYHVDEHNGRSVEAIRNLPSAEPERKKGEWIFSDLQDENEVANDNYYYVCSCCGASDLHAKSMKVPFCWKCGTDMRGEEDE